jgi:hypothetical protein
MAHLRHDLDLLDRVMCTVDGMYSTKLPLHILAFHRRKHLGDPRGNNRMDLGLKTKALNLQFDMNRRCGDVPIHQDEQQLGHSYGSENEMTLVIRGMRRRSRDGCIKGVNFHTAFTSDI